ncbi:hypothetical protein GGS21DRAFT_488051 [Xylaria nigripes]|nr:hypothetical protein GGS21DRAFT_488051 [Xylaria nigripes]
MDRQPENPPGGLTLAFRAERERREAENQASPQSQSSVPGMNILTPAGTPVTAGEIGADISPQVFTPSSDPLITPSFPQENLVETPATPASERRRSLLPSLPMAIPNAIERIRLPTRLPDGLLVMTGARAPVTMEEAQQLEQADQREHERKAMFGRRKQSMMKFMSDITSGESSPEQKQAGKWARRSFEKVKGIMSVGRAKEDSSKSQPIDLPIPPLEKDVRVGNALMLAEEENVPEFHQHVMKPFASQYPHTTAALAYEEGRKVSVYEQGYRAGLEKARLDKEFEEGYQAGLKAYRLAPRATSPVRPEPEKPSEYVPIYRRDGSVVFRTEIMDEVSQMMDNLDIPRADGQDAPGAKGKGMAKPRHIWEVVEFAKNVSSEMQKML